MTDSLATPVSDSPASTASPASPASTASPANPVATAATSALSRLVTVERTGSTNDDLRAALTGPDGLLDPVRAAAWPHLSALRALTQEAGRGRGDHEWVTPPRSSLTVSLVLRPLVTPQALAWLPLLAGLAVAESVDALLVAAGAPYRARTAWPNDVVLVPVLPGARPVEGWGTSRKVAGILAELVAPGQGATSTDHAPAGAPASRDEVPAVVLGVGVNLTQGGKELPVPWATSLAVAGALPEGADGEDLAQALLEDTTGRLAQLLGRWEAQGGDPDAGDGTLGAALRATCTTLGRQVTTQAPGGPLSGTAVGMDPRLLLRVEEGPDAGRVLALAAGEVRLTRLQGARTL